MTQPRKEQVKNIQAKFSLIDPRLSSGSVGPGLGPTSSSTFVVAGSPSPLAVFLGSSITGSLTGCIDSSPGFIQGTNLGPFSMAATQQFSVTCPQLNGGVAIMVTIQSGDIVTLGGTPVLTTSRLAARINADLAAAMASAGFTTTIATNVNGRLQVQTPIAGDACTLTLRDVTAGLLNVFIGLKPDATNASPSISALGQTAPKRGIVVSTPDGMGGIMPVRLVNGEPCITRQSQRVHMGFATYATDVGLGQDIYAKITGVTGQKAKVSFFTTGKIAPHVITSSSNFSTLNGSDDLTITLDDPLTLGGPLVLDVTFGSSPTTVQAVVDLINAQWIAGTSPSANLGIIDIRKTTFAFADGSTFALKFNGSSTLVPVTVGSAIRTQTQLATTINNAITLAGATGGSAGAAFSQLFIGSTNTDPNVSSVQILAGTNGDMSALLEMEISPGVYHGSAIAKLYGNDEIIISNPSRNPGATLSIASSGPTLAKLGLSAVSVGVTTGEEPAIPGSPVKVLIPEAMEFGEIPSNQDSVVETFLTINQPSVSDPTLGISNAGHAAILDENGKLPSSVLGPIANLSLETISLGARSVATGADIQKPRITAVTNSAIGYMLLITLPDSAGSTGTIRFYVDTSGNFVRTVNCYYDSVSPGWNKDTGGSAAYLTFFGANGSVANKARLAAETSPWSESGWRIITASGTNTPTPGGLLQAGFGSSDTLAGQLIPRLEAAAANSNLTLVQEVVHSDGSSFASRAYFDPTTGAVIRTCNAKWNGTAWAKDVNGTAASWESFGITQRLIQTRFPANDATWTSWDDFPLSEQYNILGNIHAFSGRISAGGTIPATAFGRGSPRYSAIHNSSTVQQRTLMQQWTGGGGLNYRLYRCYEPSGTFAYGDCLIETSNCYWDESIFQWRQDTANDCTLTVTHNDGKDFFFRSVPGSPWADSGFILASSHGARGIKFFNGPDGFNASAATNQVNQFNIPKAWGRVLVARSGGVLTVTSFDSFNISGYSLDVSGTAFYANLYAGIPSSDATVVSSVFSVPFIVPGPSPGTASGIMNSPSTSQIVLVAYNGSGTVLNFNTNGTVMGFQFAVFGKQ